MRRGVGMTSEALQHDRVEIVPLERGGRQRLCAQVCVVRGAPLLPRVQCARKSANGSGIVGVGRRVLVGAQQRLPGCRRIGIEREARQRRKSSRLRSRKRSGQRERTGTRNVESRIRRKDKRRRRRQRVHTEKQSNGAGCGLRRVRSVYPVLRVIPIRPRSPFHVHPSPVLFRKLWCGYIAHAPANQWLGASLPGSSTRGDQPFSSSCILRVFVSSWLHFRAAAVSSSSQSLRWWLHF